jgi:hypothetical protein
MKTCYKCKEIKDKAEFNKSQTACRPCGRAISRAYYEKNKERMKKQIRVTSDRNQAILKEEVNEIKSQPCMDCGVSYPPYVMDFDHRPGVDKGGLVSKLVGNGSRKRVYEEIAKCDVVCSNCHRIRTHMRRNKE